MPCDITCVDPGSPAARAGVRPGDILLSANGHPVSDRFDYQFYTYESRVTLTLLRDGAEESVFVNKREGEDPGLTFASYLMDSARSCRNSCIFCFIDQMPPGMRETLYFKDDDARLSFLQGNYITLTNLTEEDVERIIRMRISPINVSVHTTNPALRVKMLRNARAGESLSLLSRFREAGLPLNAQIVACPGWNDGAELSRTLRDLEALAPELMSVSVVPVGLTKYRDGLTPLSPVGPSEARELIRLVDGVGDARAEAGESRLFYCADELYLMAGLPLPSVDYYEDFPQIENGVGMAALFSDEFLSELGELSGGEKAAPFLVATGALFAPELRKLIDLLAAKCNNIHGSVVPVENSFFGGGVTVAGLVTGSDLVAALTPLAPLPRVFFPETMLRSGESVFLDDLTVEDVSRALGAEVTPVRVSGDALVNAILNR